MSDILKQWEEATTSLVAQSVKDPEFRKELLADPKGTVEKYAGQKLPADTKISVHEMDANNIHFVIPKPVDTSDLELSDEQLELVSGGEFFITAAVIGAISAVTASGVGAGISVANDQTRARHGW